MYPKKINLDTTVKLAAHIAEMMVFVLLGVVTINVFFLHKDSFDLNFTLWNVLFVTVIRFLVVFLLGWILNRFATKPLTTTDLVVISYSGLRGGIAFGMIYSLRNGHFSIVASKYNSESLEYLTKLAESNVLCSNNVDYHLLYHFRPRWND